MGFASLSHPTSLIEPLETFPLNWGQRFAHATHSLWEWDDPTIQGALIEAMERMAESFGTRRPWPLVIGWLAA